MPPRKATNLATRNSQSTISFGGRNKVTKPSASHALKDTKSRITSPLAKKALEEEVVSIEAPTTSLSPETKKATTVEKQKSTEEVEAEKIGDAQIRRYWRAREAERIAGRVHQEDLSVEEKILRLFDISSNYGPCIGMDRLKRWNRASRLGLSPPIEVLAVLLKERSKGEGRGERAYIDELLNARIQVEA